MAGLDSAAFRLALRGVAVFPLAPGAKTPTKDSRGYLDASDDPDVARAIWAKHPTANIGAATGSRSGFWVLDVDARHDGLATLARLEPEHGTLSPTIEAATPSGGRHLYWKWPEQGAEIRNSAGRVGPGLDVRGEGGSIVMPPSVLADGRRYAWRRTGARAFAEAPAWLIAGALPPPPPPRPEPGETPRDCDKYVASAITAGLNAVANARAGVRNCTLNRAAFAIGGFVRAGVVPDDWAAAQLEARALEIGLPAIEARRTIASAFRAAVPRELPNGR